MERSVKAQNRAPVTQKHYQGHLLVLFPSSAWSAVWCRSGSEPASPCQRAVAQLICITVFDSCEGCCCAMETPMRHEDDGEVGAEGNS